MGSLRMTSLAKGKKRKPLTMEPPVHALDPWPRRNEDSVYDITLGQRQEPRGKGFLYVKPDFMKPDIESCSSFSHDENSKGCHPLVEAIRKRFDLEDTDAIHRSIVLERLPDDMDVDETAEVMRT